MYTNSKLRSWYIPKRDLRVKGNATSWGSALGSLNISNGDRHSPFVDPSYEDFQVDGLLRLIGGVRPDSLLQEEDAGCNVAGKHQSMTRNEGVYGSLECS